MEENEYTMSTQEGKPKRTVRLGVCIVLCALLLAVGFLGGFLGGMYAVDGRARNLAFAVHRVAKDYYKEVDEDVLYDMMYDALELDRFCTHYTPEEYASLVEESQGYGEGYGVALYDGGDGVRLYRVVGNSPADRAGLRRGIYLRRFGEEGSLREGSAEEMIAYLQTHPSAVLECGFSPDGSDAKAYAVTREKFAAAYCSYSDSEESSAFRGEEHTLQKVGEGMSALGGKTAYVRLEEFDGRADEEFAACLSHMKERGRTDLILDLRGNGGGYLTILCSIASHLLREAEGNSPLVATARFRDGSETQYRADGNDFSSYFLENSHIRVLADEDSASASEALIGAMLDYGTLDYRDIYLRGEGGSAHTFGKGVMQTTFTTPDGNAMRVTAAEIFWPKGKSIHGTGIRKEDGASVIEAPLLPGEEDFFLTQLLT